MFWVCPHIGTGHESLYGGNKWSCFGIVFDNRHTFCFVQNVVKKKKFSCLNEERNYTGPHETCSEVVEDNQIL